jgi:hypothetical protein
MQRRTRITLWGLGAFAVVVALALVLQSAHGDAAVARLWGFGILGLSLVFLVRARIPVFIGRKRAGTLVGWRKAYVLVPAFALGLAVAAFPEQALQVLEQFNRRG